MLDWRCVCAVFSARGAGARCARFPRRDCGGRPWRVRGCARGYRAERGAEKAAVFLACTTPRPKAYFARARRRSTLSSRPWRAGRYVHEQGEPLRAEGWTRGRAPGTRVEEPRWNQWGVRPCRVTCSKRRKRTPSSASLLTFSSSLNTCSCPRTTPAGGGMRSLSIARSRIDVLLVDPPRKKEIGIG